MWVSNEIFVNDWMVIVILFVFMIKVLWLSEIGLNKVYYSEGNIMKYIEGIYKYKLYRDVCV